MIQPIIEAWVQRVCGRYLKHFDLEVTVTGRIILKDVELRVDEFRNLVLPYTPIFVYIHRATLDLPILLSSNFLLTVQDALLICERSTELSEVEPIKAQKALQMMIGILYLGLTNSMRPGNDEYGNVSSVELEYGFKSTDRLEIVIDNIHMRVEEAYDCHISFEQEQDETLNESIERSGTADGEEDANESLEIQFSTGSFQKVTALGVNIKRLLLQRPDTKTIVEDASLGEQSVWSHASDTDRYAGTNNIFVNKVIRMEGMSAHCSMKEYSAIPNKVVEREQYAKLRQNIQKEEVVECDSDMSTDDEGGGEGEEPACHSGGDTNNTNNTNDETVGNRDGSFELGICPYNDDGTFNLSYMSYLARPRPAHGDMLSNVSVTTKIKVNYQRVNQVFGPLRMHTHIVGLNLHINDAQMAFIMHLAVVLDSHMYALKQKCLRSCLFCTGSGLRTISVGGKRGEDKQRRALLRWQLIRQSVRRDWMKYTSTLREGALRWRAWFNEWRMCARYVALRELLIFHVGFEAEKRSGLQYYNLSESLLMDHVLKDVDDEGAWLIRGSKERKSGLRPYRGVGTMSKGVVRAAETLLRVKMRGYSSLGTNTGSKKSLCESSVVAEGVEEDIEEEHDGEHGATIEEMCAPGSTAALALSSRTVRALYALQLELDCTLSVAHIAYCRAKADNRFRAIREKNRRVASDMAAGNVTASSNAESQSRSRSKAVLLVGVLDAVNLTAGSLGMTRLESQCHVTIHSFSPLNESTRTSKEQNLLGSYAMSTGISRAKVNESTGTAICDWNNFFEVEMRAEENPANLDVEVECTCKGIFSPVYGNLVIPMSVLSGSHEGENSRGLAKMMESVSAAVEKEKQMGDEEFKKYAATATSPLYEGEINHLHANLNASRMQAFSGSDRVRIGSSVGPSAMQTPAGSGVSVRLFTKIVAGTPSAIAEQKNRLQELAKVAIDDRKAMVTRNQALAGRSGTNDPGDEDEDDLFVLDPTTLTVQNICASVTIAEENPLRITISSLYVVPAALSQSARVTGLEVTPVVAVPWLRVVVGGIKGKVRASNNPWIIDSRLDVKMGTIEVASAEQAAEGPSMEKVFSLPSSWLSLSAQQTSTTGLFLRGWDWAGGSSSLDESCFDWRLRGAIGPVEIDLRKPEGDQPASSPSTRSILWEGKRVFDHLFRVYEKNDASLWSRGIFSTKVGSESGGSPARLTPEAAMRLGDHYSIFPRFRNTLYKVAISTILPAEYSRVSNSSSLDIGSSKPLASQCTRLSFSTRSRQLSFGVAVAPSRASVVANKVDTTSTMGVVIDDNVDMGEERNTHATGGLFGFFSGQAVQEQAPKTRENSQAQLDAQRATLEALHSVQLKEQRDAWASEKALLEAEITALKAQIREQGEGK